VDGSRFDAFARSLAVTGTRRGVLAGLGASVLGLFVRDTADARTCSADGSVCREHANCCTGYCGPKDRTGRRRCACQAADDCPVPDACHTAICADGRCVLTPTVDFANDEANCGRCERVCPTDPHGTATCQNGICGLACDAGYALGPGNALVCGLLDLKVRLTNNWDTTVIGGTIVPGDPPLLSHEMLFFDRPPTDPAPLREVTLSPLEFTGPLAPGQQVCVSLPDSLEVGTTLDETAFVDSLGRTVTPTGAIGPFELSPGLSIGGGGGINMIIEFRASC
jgi:hypothetical protein